MLSSAVVDGTVSVEEVLAPFLESSEFQSIDELKHQIDVVFLGGGPLRGVFSPHPQSALRLRITPEDGGELCLMVMDEGVMGIELRFYGLPDRMDAYVQDVWSFYQERGECALEPSCYESVRFDGWLAMEFRGKLNELDLFSLPRPVSTQWVPVVAPRFNVVFEVFSPSDEHRLGFSSDEAHGDPLSEHLQVIRWIILAARKALGRRQSKDILKEFCRGYLEHEAPERPQERIS